MTPTQKQLNQLMLATFVAVVGVVGAFGAGVYGAVSLNQARQPAATALSVQHVVLADNVLSAKAALLLDLASGEVLYQKAGYEPLPLASLTKLMSAEVVLSRIPLDTSVLITAQDLKPEGDSGLRAGATLPLGALLRLALVASSNDAITAAVSTLGPEPVAAMNEAAAQLGLTKTHFRNPTGLDIGAQAGAVGSAYDVARLARIFFKDHPDLFELTTRAEVIIDQNGKEITSAATALPLQSIPGFVAAKTGYTDLAGGNLVAIFDLQPGQTVVAAVLGSTREGRFADIAKLIEAARASL